MERKRGRLIGMAVAAVLLVAGCGGGDDDEGAGDDDVTTTSTDDTEPENEEEEEEEEAEGEESTTELPDFLDDFIRVCENQIGFGGAAEYTAGPGPHLMAFFEEVGSFTLEGNSTECPLFALLDEEDPTHRNDPADEEVIAGLQPIVDP